MNDQTIKAILQTAWVSMAPYGKGLPSPRYCRIIIETNVAKFEILHNKVDLINDGEMLFSIRIEEHDIDKSYPGNIKGEVIKSTLIDIYGDMWLVFANDYALSNQVDNGNRLVLVKVNDIELGCVNPNNVV